MKREKNAVETARVGDGARDRRRRDTARRKERERERETKKFEKM